MLGDGIRNDIALKKECILDADTYVIHTLVQSADDMEVVIADDSPKKAEKSKFGKADVHITADEADFGALFEREPEEIIPKGTMVNGRENVKASAEVSIGNVAVVFISIVTFPGRVALSLDQIERKMCEEMLRLGWIK